MCDHECFDVDDEEIASRLELKETTGKDCLPGEPSRAAFTAADLQAEEEMALETERSSPSGASSPGPSRDVVHRSRAASDSSAPSPPIRPASASPLTRFEPETAHGDISGTRCSVTPLPPHDPLPPPAPFFPRPPLPSPASPASSSASSYHAGSPPLAPIFLPPYHHHLSPFAPPPPPPPIVAPQAILALGGLTLGGSGPPPPPMDPATVCGWPQEFISPSPARPLPHHPLTPLLGPYSTHHHHQQALLRLRPSEEALSTTPRPQRQALPQPQAPSPLPFSVDNILRPAFGLRAVLEEEERGRRRLLLGGKDRGPSPPPTLPPLPPLPPAPKKKRKAPEATPPPLPTRDEAGGPQQQTTGGPLEAASSPAKAEGADGAKVEPKLPNPENGAGSKEPMLWPAWVYCTRYSDRPSSGPRSRRVKRKERSKSGEGGAAAASAEEKRPRTAFSAEQLSRLKQEFAESRYLTEKRRQTLARDLRLNESQIKIWFQNKRAKIKKASGQKGGLALQLMAQGLYNHSTVPVDEDEEEEAAAAAAAANAANAAVEEEKRRQAAMGIVGPPPPSPLIMGGGGVPGAMPLDTRPPPLLVER